MAKDPKDEALDRVHRVYYGNLSAFFSRRFDYNMAPSPDDWISLIFLLDYAIEPKDGEPTDIISWRAVTSNADCQSPRNSSFATDSQLLIHQGDGANNSITWSGPRSRSAITWATHDNIDCGPRCKNVQALVPISGPEATDELYHFYNCSSTVSEIWMLSSQAEETYNNAPGNQIPDLVARIFAGAIGSEKKSPDDDTVFYSQPTEDRDWYLPPQNVSTKIIEHYISFFSTAAVGAMDLHGGRVEVSGYPPKTLQTLNVKWLWVILILAGLHWHNWS
jgi:hypothetical protein